MTIGVLGFVVTFIVFTTILLSLNKMGMLPSGYEIEDGVEYFLAIAFIALLSMIWCVILPIIILVGVCWLLSNFVVKFLNHKKIK